MRPLDDSARDALAAYKRSRSPEARTRHANWAAIENALNADDLAGESRRSPMAARWIAASVALAAAAGMLLGLRLVPRDAEDTSAPAPSAAVYTQAEGTGERAAFTETVTDRSEAPRRDAAIEPEPPVLMSIEPEPPPIADEAPPIADEAPPVDARPARTRARSVPRPSIDAPTDDRGAGLRAEATLVHEARAALTDGRPRVALDLLGAHRRRFPSGVLVEEVAALELAALCHTGPADRWRRAHRAFASKYPRSPLLAQVREDCFR